MWPRLLWHLSFICYLLSYGPLRPMEVIMKRANCRRIGRKLEKKDAYEKELAAIDQENKR